MCHFVFKFEHRCIAKIREKDRDVSRREGLACQERAKEMMLYENGDAQGAIRYSLDKADRIWPRWAAANDAQRVVRRQDIIDEAMDAEA
jgi:hypothetical protein